MATLTRAGGFDVEVARFNEVDDRLIDGQILVANDARADLLAAVLHRTVVKRRSLTVAFGPFVFETCRACERRMRSVPVIVRDGRRDLQMVCPHEGRTFGSV